MTSIPEEVCDEVSKKALESVYNKTRRERLKAEGLCCVCAKKPPFKVGGSTCSECIAAQKRSRQRLVVKQKTAGLCLDCSAPRAASSRRFCSGCILKYRERQAARYGTEYGKATRRKRMREYRLEAFAAYGGAFCKCCGESMIECLTFDHVNNDGAAHRKLTGGGDSFVQWLRCNGYPPGIQVLCWNCNVAKKYSGVCPHELARQQQQGAALV